MASVAKKRKVNPTSNATEPSAKSRKMAEIPSPAPAFGRSNSDATAAALPVPSLQRSFSDQSRPAAMAAKAPQKKMVIKPFKVKPKPPESFESETLSRLEQSVNAVFCKEGVPFAMEDLYRSVENLCLHKKSAEIYQKLFELCESHIGRAVTSLLHQSADLVVFLGAVASVWEDFCVQLRIIRSIFLYLDRTYVIQNVASKSIWEMGVQIFCSHFRSHADIENKTVQGVLLMIEQERRGELVNQSLIKTVVRMFTAMKIYSEVFEQAFLQTTSSFYAEESQRLVFENNMADYLRHAATRIQQENDRVFAYLEESTRRVLIAEVEKQLVKAHIETILEPQAFERVMEENRKEDLSRLYSLLSRVNGLLNLRATLGAYTKKVGLAIVMDEQKDKDMVESLLTFKSRLDEILSECFRSHDELHYVIKESWEQFVNARKNRPAELIAKFIDEKLKNTKGSTEQELDDLLDKVMVIFRYIHGKDVFEAFYKNCLAKRLLLGKSASVDLEKSTIAKLHKECGQAFTSKLEGMFKDIEHSKEIMTAFSQYMEQKRASTSEPQDVDLEAFVLTQGCWPQYPEPTEISLPPEVASLQEEFKNFYLNKHNGRKLIWQHSLAHCLLKAHFPHGRHELILSAYQAVVLMCFNQSDSLSYLELKQQTGIGEKDLLPTLASLACGKVRVLEKDPASNSVAETDKFNFNAGFRNKMFRIKINAMQMKETKEEKETTDERIHQDRQYQIDAAIVRIMKTRKTLKHNELITETFQQLRFPCTQQDLKKRIESLIEREYLERDESNAQLYNYLA